MTKRKMTAKQAKYFGKGHGKVSRGGKKSKKGGKKMPMVNGKPAWLSGKKNKKGAKGHMMNSQMP